MQEWAIMRFRCIATAFLAGALFCSAEASEQTRVARVTVVDAEGKSVEKGVTLTCYQISKGQLETRIGSGSGKGTYEVSIQVGARVTLLVVTKPKHGPAAITPPPGSRDFAVRVVLYQSGKTTSASQALGSLESYEKMKSLLLAASEADRRKLLDVWLEKLSLIEQLRSVRIPASASKDLYRLLTNKKQGLYRDFMVLRAGGDPRRKKE